LTKDQPAALTLGTVTAFCTHMTLTCNVCPSAGVAVLKETNRTLRQSLALSNKTER